MSARRRSVLGGLLLAALLSTAAPLSTTGLARAAQDDEPARRVTRWLDYLATNPYHERAFEGLVEAALEHDGLAPLLEALARSGDDATRVLRARLFARTGELERALAQLAQVAQPTADTRALSGALYLRDERYDEALRDLDLAARGLSDRERLEAVHRLRAEARIARGDPDGAAAALVELAELDADDPLVALDVARRLADWRLYDAALAQYRAAEARAGDDASRRCEALFERGRVHERLGQVDAALEAWEAALAGVGRGHWLAARTEARILAAHERAGTLDAYVAERVAALDAAPRDLRARERLAEALAASGDARAALEATSAAVVDHPGDRRLAELRRALFLQANDLDGAIAELQRALERAPDERALRIELGELFLQAGRPDACAREWRPVLEGAHADAATVRTLAARWAEAGELQRAARAYERAVELEPLELRGHDELATVLARAGDMAALEIALQRAEAAQPETPSWLDAVARLRRRHRHLDEALRLLRRADALEPDRPERLRELALVLAEHGARQESSATWHRLIEIESAPGARARAAARLVRGLRSARELRVWIVRERDAITDAPDTLAPRWVLAELYRRVGDEDAARDTYAELVALTPEDVGAGLAFADALERGGELLGALGEYERLLELAPERARELRAKCVPLLVGIGQRAEAAALVRATVAESPGNAAALREAADWYEQLGMADAAFDALARATRIEPQRADARLAYAGKLAARGENAAARRELIAAHRHGAAEQRAEAVELIMALAPPDQLRGELDALLARLSNETGAARDARLAVDLALASDGRARAATRRALMIALARSPHEPALIEAHAHLLTMTGDHDGAIAAFQALALDPDRDPEASLYDHLAAQLGAREPTRALALARRAQDPVRAARLFVQAGFQREAATLLAATPKRTQQRALALQLLAELAEEAGELEVAADAMAERIGLVGADVAQLRRLGAIQAALGRRAETLATGRRLLELAGEGPAAQEYFARHALESEYTRLRAERVLRHPGDELAVRAFFEQVLREDAGEAVVLELVDGLRRASRVEGRRPERHGVLTWHAFLDQLELDFYATRLELAQERLIELSERLARGERLNEREWNHVLHHQRMGSEIRERERELFSAALAQHPRSSVLRTTLGARYRVAREYKAAAVQLLAALELREATERMADESRRKRLEREEVWLELQTLLAARIDIAAPGFPELAVRLMRTVVFDRILPRFEPELAELVRHAGLCLARADRRAEARALLAELEPADEDRLPELEFAAEAWLEAGFPAESARVVERVLARWRVLACRPECAGWDEWLVRSRRGLERVAMRRWTAGDAVGAALLLRRIGAPGAAFQLVVERDLFAAAGEELAARLAELERVLSGDAFARWPEQRDLTLFLAELLELRDRRAEARALLEQLALLDPSDPTAQRALSLLEERGLDRAAAARARSAAQELERARRRAVLAGGCDDARLSAQPFDALADVHASLVAQREPLSRDLWRELREPSDSDPDRALVGDSLALARLAFAAEHPAGVALALAPLAEERVPAESFVTPLFDWLGELPPDSLGEHEPAVLRVACEAPGAEVGTLVEFVEALLRQYRIDEARRAIATFRSAHGPLAPLEEKHLGLLDARVGAVETDGR